MLKPIQLDHHFEICRRLRAVSFEASYGSLAGFDAEYGENYRHRLAQKIAEHPQANCHLWSGGHIIGQTEAKDVADKTVGYINLLAVLPEFQRRGYGMQMMAYLEDYFFQLGKTQLQLSVSGSNEQALGFYEKNGWSIWQPKPNRPEMLLMRKDIRSAHG